MYKLEDIIQDLKHDTPEVSVLEVIECLEQAQDTISDLQAKVEELTAALKSIISETDEWVCCHDVNQIAKNALSWKVSDE